jgi:hypothetical protein
MSLFELFGLVFIALGVLNFIVGFFAVKTPLTLDKIEETEIMEEENFSEIYSGN